MLDGDEFNLLADETWPDPPLFRGGRQFPCYRWPQTGDEGTWWIPQTSVRKFLDSNRVDRTHPEIQRRHSSRTERNLLVHLDVLTKSALYCEVMVMRADEVMIIMEHFYPRQWNAFLVLSGVRSKPLPGAAASVSMEDRFAAITEASEFNHALAEERQEDRR
eukprot:UC1_evm1s1297